MSHTEHAVDPPGAESQPVQHQHQRQHQSQSQSQSQGTVVHVQCEQSPPLPHPDLIIDVDDPDPTCREGAKVNADPSISRKLPPSSLSLVSSSHSDIHSTVPVTSIPSSEHHATTTTSLLSPVNGATHEAIGKTCTPSLFSLYYPTPSQLSNVY
jgi:hypothetical protein